MKNTHLISLGAVTAAMYNQYHNPELAITAIIPTIIAGIV